MACCGSVSALRKVSFSAMMHSLKCEKRFMVIPGGVKMENWARAGPKIKFLKNVLKIFYRWPLTYVTMAKS